MSNNIRSMFEQAPPRKVERRRGPDKKGKLALALSIAGWAFWFAGIYVANFAFPQLVTYFDRLYDKSPRVSWEPEFLYVSEIIWVCGAAGCVLSLILLHARNKRRTDKPHYGIIAALGFNALTSIGFAIFIITSGF